MNWLNDYLSNNPDMASLPVIDRGRSHITFAQAEKFITVCGAHPIHYHDGESWNPIDTNLSLLDEANEEYGASGLFARIRKNGIVRVLDANGNLIHRQRSIRAGIFNRTTKGFTSLLTFPVGQVIGDSIYFERPKYHYRIQLTDTGIRETLTIDECPDGNANEWAVIESEFGSTQLIADGWVDNIIERAERKFPIPYGMDANGTNITLRRYAKYQEGTQYLYTGISIDDLSQHAFPVVFDPDFLDMTVDGYIYGINASYATARATSSAFDTTDTNIYVGQSYVNPNRTVYRGFLKFDTTGIPSLSAIQQVNLKLVCTQDNSGTNFDVQIVKQDWSAQDPIATGNREAAYDNCLAGTQDGNIWRNTNGMSINTQYTSGNLHGSWIVKGGYTYYSLRSSRDAGNNAPTGLEYILIASQNHVTVAYRPILTVTWVTGIGLDEQSQIIEALKLLTGKAAAENISLSEIFTLLIGKEIIEEWNITDTIEALKVALTTQTEVIDIQDFIDLLSGRTYAENITATDLIIFLAQSVQSGAITLTDLMNFYLQMSQADNVPVTDTIIKAIQTIKAENISIDDYLSTYIFQPNRPLQLYQTRMLVDFYMTSGTKHYSTEDIYVSE